MDVGVYKQIMDKSKMGYAFCKRIGPCEDAPHVYEFIEVNHTFEEMSGLKESDIVGTKVQDVISCIILDRFDWIKQMSEIAANGDDKECGLFSGPLNKWYRIRIFSPQENHFITLFSETQADQLVLNSANSHQHDSPHFFANNPDAELAVNKIDLKQAESSLQASEIRYRRLFESAKDGILILNYDTGMIMDVNPFLIELLGFTKEQFLDKAIWDIGFFKDYFTNRENFSELQGNEYIRYEDMPLKTVDGHQINVEFISNVYFADDMKVIQCNIRDITERKLAEKTLKDSEKKYSDYIENAPDGVFVIDHNGTYMDVNNVASRITGYSKDELLKMSIKEITTEESLAAALVLFRTLVETGSANGELQFNRKDGLKRWWSVDAVRLSEQRFLGFASDITKRKNMEELLVYNNYHDQLTGLYNRRYFDESLMEQDKDTNLPLAIVICDVNGLKLVNDSMGHVVGDNLLIYTADIIKRESRPEDIIARTSGDSFSMILPRFNPLEIEEFINRIKIYISQVNNMAVVFSISFGYAIKTNATKKAYDVLTEAEDYLFKHKLYDNLSMRSRSIDLIMNTLFEKSKREMLHSMRVSEICEMISVKVYSDKEDVRKIKLAGLIHDIGKIGINENILNKPGKLTQDEWLEMYKHPEISWRILSSVKEFSELADCILEHHERWDGKGYPKGLKGERIALGARIIALADSFDAMTSNRSYRKSLSVNQAIEEIEKNSGTQFDPELAAVFVDLIKKDINKI